MLNPDQQKAVKTTEGPVRIIAGAGTGKTHTLISRIAYLINEKKIDPQKILSFTFTNKAAHELSERLMERGLPTVHSMTFHSLAAKLLRQFWKDDFKIIIQKEQVEILQEIISSDENMKDVLLGLDEIRNLKAPFDSAQRAFRDGNIPKDRLQNILSEYRKILSEKNLVDFTGLLETLLRIWSERQDVLMKCQNLYLYIMVDEYQDVNGLQIKIMQKLSELHQNICVVGDGDQTIYSWRGARAEIMTEFERMYKNVRSISLTKNYRNSPAILKGAEKLISHNIGRLKKSLQPVSTKTDPITLWESESSMQQMEVIYYLLEGFLGSIGSMHMADFLDTNRNNDFRKFGDIALLYRTKFQGKMLYENLSKRGYPCQISTPNSFWGTKEVVEFLEAIENLSKWTDIDANQKFSKWISDKISKFVESEKLTKAKISRLNHLVSFAMAFDHLTISEAIIQLLDEAHTQQEADNLIQADKINLLTLHAAKGLEFPIVLIIGLEEGNIPHKKSLDSSYWLAEERRLLYVGMTRATHELHIFRNKKREGRELMPSRFLKEIGSDNFVSGKMPEVKIRQIQRREIKKAQMKLF